MLGLVKYVYRSLVPESLRYKRLRRKEAKLVEAKKNELIKYYSNNSSVEITSEMREAITYLKNNPMHVFPYDFNKQFDPKKINVLLDEKSGLRCVMHEGRKLFFKKSWPDERIKDSYSFLLTEQHADSPHRYLTKEFFIDNNFAVADAGAAEGIFALTFIDKIKHLYMFETDPEWIAALNETYKPWKEKVTIINKFVSDKDDDKHVSLDAYFGDKVKLDFLKIDVDGAETELLRGADKLLSSNNKLKLTICTYHRQQDEKLFSKLLMSRRFSVQTSSKYMLFYFDANFKEPYFRRGLIRAVK